MIQMCEIYHSDAKNWVIHPNKFGYLNKKMLIFKNSFVNK